MPASVLPERKMEGIQPIASSFSSILELPPSCIQFCPAHPDLFVVGTYNLEREENQSKGDNAVPESDEPSNKPQTRNGSLLVFRINGTEPTLIQTVQQPSAVLDIRFHPTERGILAVASSTASLGIYKLEESEDATAPLRELAVSEPLGPEIGTLFLQCQWHPTQKSWLGVTASTGLAYLVELSEDWTSSRMTQLNLESPLEPWSIAFSPTKPPEDGSTGFSIYTGSDDSVLRFSFYSVNHERSSDDQCIEETAPLVPLHSAIVTKKHMAGVTAILPLALTTPDGGRLVITGSYDDHIRLFSIHDLDQTGGFAMVRLLVEENLGGGVWRLDPVKIEKIAGSWKIIILVSCMHAGARVVELSSVDGAAWDCNVLARFEEHKSMNYGSDFVRGTDNALLRCVTTSFYDRLLCVWEYKYS
ncbi:hypothetical protein NLU13_8394 [Sarocladium strictum]|uniref:Uncharacterized protein n=1 Tax=Sarocladium strictum TaxID=5046 RepID=A0AA39GBX8_SARSR|nr:hypothetical protein NLU13_8394 [Sarocladium strictum]